MSSWEAGRPLGRSRTPEPRPEAPRRTRTAWSPRGLAVGPAIPRSTAISRPNEAPLLTPRTDGSASGFREIAWNPRPASDRHAPTIPARSVRGRRIFRTMVAAASQLSALEERPDHLPWRQAIRSRSSRTARSSPPRVTAKPDVHCDARDHPPTAQFASAHCSLLAGRRPRGGSPGPAASRPRRPGARAAGWCCSERHARDPCESPERPARHATPAACRRSRSAARAHCLRGGRPAG